MWDQPRVPRGAASPTRHPDSDAGIAIEENSAPLVTGQAADDLARRTLSRSRSRASVAKDWGTGAAYGTFCRYLTAKLRDRTLTRCNHLCPAASGSSPDKAPMLMHRYASRFINAGNPAGETTTTRSANAG